MTATEITVEILVTSFHASPRGGGILIGTDEQSGRLRRVRLAKEFAARPPRSAERWRITGTWVQDPVYGAQLQALRALPVLHRGEAITRWIAENPSIPGVGKATAAKLWRTHGQDLYRILREADANALVPTVGPAAASAIATEFCLLTQEVTVLEHFDRWNIDPSTAIAACRLWGASAIQKLKDNPYNLTLLQPWSAADRRAAELGIAPEDERRLLAAVSEVMARRYRPGGRAAGGHTAAFRREIIAGTRQLLGRATAHLAERAFELAKSRGEIIQCGELWQARGPHLMERAIEEAIQRRNSKPPEETAVVAEAIREIETELGIQLDSLQVEAVRTASLNKFAVVDGPAGTGKSLVTRAIMTAVQRSGRSYTQMALSGRAAKRLWEATGYEALTVHRFLKEMANGRRKLSPGVLVIDEASMISTADLWQIVSWARPETSLVLVGDPAQLPPIGAGNPLAAIVANSEIPRISLRNIHRQSGASPIPVVANVIREGDLPRLPAFDFSNPTAPGVFIAPCDKDSAPLETLRIFEAFVGAPAAQPDREAMRRLHGARSQILGMTIHGPAGVRALSDAIEDRWLRNQPPVPGWGLSEGSKILWTRNSYEHPVGRLGADGKEITADIMNGSLGIVQRATACGATVLFDDEAGTRAEIRISDLDRVSRGWAVTVHKAQGSAFDTVIVPIVPSRLLDRQMLYTAITRARKTVVLVGDPQLLASAAITEPRAALRRQCFFAKPMEQQEAA